MIPPVPARPHRRALTQLVLGLAPLLAVGVALIVALGVQLPGARAPLADATATAVARVQEAGRPPEGRGVLVTFDDEDGAARTGRLVLAEPVAVEPGAEVRVRYDPAAADGPASTVYADGDAATRRVQDLVASMAVLAVVLLLTTGATALLALSRRGLRSRPAGSVAATRLVVRRGLLVRSWLELETARGPRWLPVFWTPELTGLEPGGRIDLHGDPLADRLVLPVVDGAEVWPSGRIRDQVPRGEQRAPRATSGRPTIGLLRQVRVDAVPAVAAPLLGLVWAWVDDGGVASFAGATALSAVLIFWLFQRLGSDPEAPARA
ncbi:DUF3592 domain-containing protein [Blastococcus sp. LR1]|uniref:DUF3592 domain-containing protein n=1 Tax=Blastococcus sp. LR1 TaxID=2877000 RepID=UPI001CCEEAA4|nr:DUF3592 domain-containing protein [Blastococcus sp. LR1]MCA0144407.1 hypothetical protein [Blastococcus sp. LR1]